MNRAMSIVAVFAGACAAGNALAQQAGTFDKWIRTWSDEFTNSTIDTTKWNISNYAPNKNAELEYYSPVAVTSTGGNLVITSTNVPRGGRAYTSGEVTTLNKYSQTYGRFEARCKLPRTKGMWPAFWMLPASQGWPPEIDIMEMLGHQPTRVYMSHHWGTAAALQSFSQGWTGPDFSAGFHEFRVDWYPDALLWQVDGVQRVADGNAVPQEPMYLILNNAVGGIWPGNPDGTTVFPQQYQIDWVRAYKCIINSSFDQFGPAGNVSLWSWNKFGNAYTDAGHPRNGAQSLKLFGPFAGTPSTSGVYQDFPAKPGETFRASAYFQNRIEDRMAGANTANINIEFRNAAGTLISYVSAVGLDANSPTNVYVKQWVDGVAPANTATARMVINFYQPASTAGAAFIDDAEFGYFTPCTGDFNKDGSIDFFDYLDFVDDFSLGAATGDFNSDGSIDFFDYLDFVSAYTTACP